MSCLQYEADTCKLVNCPPIRISINFGSIESSTISIIGAGPAGLTAAIVLKKHGYPVNLYEQKEEVGTRFNGDYQGLENWSDDEDTLEIIEKLGLEINFLCHPYYGKDGVFYGPNLKAAKIRTSRPLFYLIERGNGANSLDNGLLRQAQNVGVNILWGEKIELLNQGATIIGTGPKAADAIAKGMVFNTTLKNTFIGLIDDQIAPKAYAYLLVCNGKATFATCLFKDFKNEKHYFDKAKETLKSIVDIDITEPREFGGYVNYFSTPKFSKDEKTLYVGENAGFQDALWGFGIKYAMLSGFYAAQSIITNNNYEKLCQKSIVPKLKTSLANRWLYAHLSNVGYSFILNKISQVKDVIPILNKHYNDSWNKRLVYQIAKVWYHSRLVDKQCMHKNCNCVWCRHANHGLTKHDK